jgi:hypothetical protein
MANERDFQMMIRIPREMRKKIARYLSSLDDEVLTRNDFINNLLEGFFEQEGRFQDYYNSWRGEKPKDKQVKEFLDGFKQ